MRFSRHAIERMFQRDISPDIVHNVIENGEVIATYPDDKPYPSDLILGFEIDKPVHVVVANNQQTGECYIVTVYRPDSAVWNHDFKTRRQ